MPDFVFDVTEGVYRFKGGKQVPQERIDNLVAKAADKASERLERLAKSYAKGTISHPEWVTASTDQIKAAHRAVAMIAAGGKDRMGPKQWGHVGGRLRSELAYLDRFVNLADNAARAELGDAFIARAASYGQSVYMTHADGLARRHQNDETASLEANELDDGAEHCDDCLDQTDAGEVPIGTLIPIGERSCQSRCRCRLVYSGVAA